METLGPGAYFKIGGEGFEFAGMTPSKSNPQGLDAVGRINPDLPPDAGETFRTFAVDDLQKDAIRVGPFNELFPYSHYAKEKQVWSKNFGSEIQIPYPSQELIDALRSSKEVGVNSLVPHYFPGLEITSNNVISINGKSSPLPEKWGEFELDFGNFIIPLFRAQLGEGWVLVDTTPKPDSVPGVEYPSDPFKSVLDDLVVNHELTNVWPGSRFNISPRQLYEKVCPAIAKFLNTDPANTSFIKSTEFYLLGNMFHPELGEKTAKENFSDDNEELQSVLKTNGNLVNFGWGSSFDQYFDTGFRPIIRFPIKIETSVIDEPSQPQQRTSIRFNPFGRR